MSKLNRRLFPAPEALLQAFAARLRGARLRRRISAVLFAERMGVSRDTLNRLEKGDQSIGIGHYIRAMRLVELEKDLELLAANDVVGERIAEGWLQVDSAPPAVKKAMKDKEQALLQQAEMARRKPNS